MAEPEPERLVRDVHPAEVLLPQGRVILDARAFITDRRLIAYRVGKQGIERALELELAQPVSVPKDRGSLQGALEVHLADGETVWVNRGRGCGCGSPLLALAAPAGW